MLKLEKYNNFKVIHEGHRYDVYSAIREEDKKSVVVKVLRSTTPKVDDIASMYHEYEVTKDLDLPGVIKTYELVEEDNHFSLIEEDIQGISLRSYIKEHPLVDLGIFYKIALQMVKIIGEIHAKNIIHKDIKPDNFIINPQTLTVKLTDFALSTKIMHDSQGMVSVDKLEGTIAYMAPEQTGRMNMNIDYRVDFYALGVTFFELLTGQLPFQFSDPLEIISAHLSTPAPDASKLNSKIPPNLSAIIKKLMAKDPSHRYQSAYGIHSDLTKCSTAENELFPLAQEDRCERLNFSQKIYGREEESKALLDVYEKVSKGDVKILMVCGYSGIGKTTLINEVHKPMVEHKGYFISGKFDQLKRNTPYTAITEALNQLAKWIMAEPEERFEKIKKDLSEALKGSAQVIIDLAPEFEKIFGKQSPLEKLPPQEATNRMMMVTKRFFEVVAKKDHPLVLFIDDLQWIDSSSQNLLEWILTDQELSHLLFIGAYRDNEVDETHSLRRLFKDKSICFLPLKPLTTANFESFFNDTFARSDTLPLAELIHKRTDGNPFFCKQLISTIYQKKLLYFDFEQYQWNWNLHAIKELSVTDNVVDLMLSKLQALPQVTQALLKYAACIGHRFNMEILQVISGKSAESISIDLMPAVNDELLRIVNASYKKLNAMKDKNLSPILSKEIVYQFSHDRIQQAVYQSLSEEEKQHTHYEIAKILLRKEPEASRGERLFEVTDHFNQALPLIEDKTVVVKLNYQAATKAREANAYQPMSNYLEAALSLMNDSWWKSNYEITYEVHRDYILSLFLLSKHHETEELSNKILSNANTNIHKASIYRILILEFLVQNQIDKALDIGKKALDLLGVDITLKPTKISLSIQWIKIKWQMRKFHVENLEKKLLIVTDPEKTLAFQILFDLTVPLYWKDPSLYFSNALTAIRLMLRFGKPKSAGVWISSYAIFLLFNTKNVELAFKYWDVAERIFQESPDKYSSGFSYILAVFLLLHFRYSMKVSEEYCHKCVQDSQQSGNIYSLLFGKITFGGIAAFEAKSLDKMISLYKAAVKVLLKAGTTSMAELFEMIGIIYENELNDAHEVSPRLLQLIQSIESEKVPRVKVLKMKVLMVHNYFSENYEEFLEYHLLTYRKEGKIPLAIGDLQRLTLESIVLLKAIKNARGITKWTYRNHFSSYMRDLRWASEACPSNFLHLYLLPKAEQAKFDGNYQEALKLFDAAITNAKKGNFYHWVAIGDELAGNMLMELQEPRCALDYIREARDFYERYGNKMKVHVLEKRYPEVFVGSEQKKDSTVSGSISGTTASVALDFLSIIKASQTISGEILPEQLFEKMLYITRENAGAEKVVFIEKQKNGDWMVVALLGQQFKIHAIPLKDSTDIPRTAINLVIRSNKPLVIADGSKEDQLSDDEYIQRVKPKSILCVPIIHHDKTIGVLYLENNLAAGCFVQDRVKVLQMLASQIAISLENSRYLERMQQLFIKTERFVPKPFLKILNKESVEVVSLGDCVKKEITVLFNDIRSFTTLIESRTPEKAFAFINRYWKFMAPVIRKYNGYIDQYQGDAILAIFPNKPSDGVRAAVDMMKALAAFNIAQQEVDDEPIQMGIGLSTGLAMLGVIGEDERQVSGIISDVANTAARIEGLNKVYGSRILFSSETAKALAFSPEILFRRIDRVKLKGKVTATEIYELIEWAPLLQNIQIDEYLQLFNEGLNDYFAGNFKQAKNGFHKCLNHYPNDQVIAVIIERCDRFLESGVPSDWDGTFVMKTK